MSETSQANPTGVTAEGPASATDGSPTDSPPGPCLDCLPRSHEDDYPFREDDCDACDSKTVEIRCQATGVKARADYAAAHASAPGPEAYETVRLEYGKARYEVQGKVRDQRERLKDALHEIRCRLDDARQVGCLDTAWERVRARLDACRVHGCCVESYDFDPQLSDCHVEHLLAQVARFSHVTDQADGCFARLAAEPAALRARLDSVVAEIDAIHAALHPPVAALATAVSAAAPTTGGAGNTVPASGSGTSAEPTGTSATTAPASPPAATDLAQLYAQGLNAGRHLDDVWWGYRDVDEFVDCLCRAMRVSMEGHQALAELQGELAVREARWDERNKCCRRLREHAVEEIIEGFVRCLEEGRPKGPRDEPPPDRDRDRDRDHDRDRDRDHDRDRDRDHDRDRDRDRE
jgi:hypothetical protein